jgi:hypothetical protein
MLRRVALVRTDVSEEPSASVIRVKRIGELRKTLAATSNRKESHGVTSPKTEFFSCWIVDIFRRFWGEDGSVVYDCWRSSPMQLFSGPNPEGLLTVLYYLIITNQTGTSQLHSPRLIWPSYGPRLWVTFSLPPSTYRPPAKKLEPPPRWWLSSLELLRKVNCHLLSCNSVRLHTKSDNPISQWKSF